LGTPQWRYHGSNSRPASRSLLRRGLPPRAGRVLDTDRDTGLMVRCAWRPAPVGRGLLGPHDLRHTFATWLEDDGIPARVIDELMGHAATRRSSWAAEGMSAMGAVYRHTTTEMEARVLHALDARLALVVEVVESTEMTEQ
jgi:integrase